MQTKRRRPTDSANHPPAGAHKRALGALLREVAATEQLIAQFAQGHARGGHGEDPAALKWEADVLADLRELADMARALAQDMRRRPDGASRSEPLRASAAQAVERHRKLAQTERDTARMLEYRALLETRIREGRHPETIERDLYRFAVLGELAEMAMTFARTGKRPDPVRAKARFADAEKIARFRLLPAASPLRH